MQSESWSTAKRDRISYHRVTQEAADRIVERHEMLMSGQLGGARANFAYADMTGLDLSGAQLGDADFTGAIMAEVVLDGAVLENATLFGADLRRASLRGAVLRRADMRGVCLRGADLTGTDLYEADLREGSIAERDRKGNLKYLKRDLGPSELPAAIMAQANLERAKMGGVVAMQADFTDANMRDCRLARANMRNATMKGAILQGADISGANLMGADLEGVVLVGADTSGVILDGANLKDVMRDEPIGKSVEDLDVPIADLLDAHEVWVKSDGREGEPCLLGMWISARSAGLRIAT